MTRAQLINALKEWPDAYIKIELVLERLDELEQDAELSRLRAEVERLEGKLANETRAMERLAGLDGDCPPVPRPCSYDVNDPQCCPKCRAAWARQKEVPRG